jgi:ribonuclease HI
LSPVVVLHLDESCLGNGREGNNPGGGGGLVEARARSGRIERRDFYIHEPATTNNRMALKGAGEALRLLAGKAMRVRAVVVSDSEYLVKGMREWAPSWERRGWTRKGGPIENLEMWQALVSAARLHEAQFTWVRGHKGHAKNEYANDLAIRAAREQIQSDGVVESGFPAWLEQKRAKKLYLAYDPDESFESLERQVASGARIPLR